MIFILIGPTCVGKTTIVKELLKNINDLYMTKSCTTRNIRPGEKHGDEYYFISKDEFQHKIENNEFIEWVEFNNNLYGTLLNEFNKKNVISILETKGAQKIKSMLNDVKCIFISPPNIDVIKKRLIARGSNENEIEKRLILANEEMKLSDSFDHKIINKNIDECVKEIKKFFKKY